MTPQTLTAAAPAMRDKLREVQRLLASYERVERDRANGVQADAIRRHNANISELLDSIRSDT